jgi:hypothetical protein
MPYPFFVHVEKHKRREEKSSITILHGIVERRKRKRIELQKVLIQKVLIGIDLLTRACTPPLTIVLSTRERKRIGLQAISKAHSI